MSRTSVAVVAAWLGLFLASGCSRTHYRLQADRDVYSAVGEKVNDPRWDLPPFDIAPPSDSRMFDPFNLDRPPLPPDDPASHHLMHMVDGKKGYPKWHQWGDTPVVEIDDWRDCLPTDKEGRVVLNMENTVQIALRNSRDYQRELEDLYLSALDVTFQRFQFTTQFFNNTATTFTADGRSRPGSGGNSSSRLVQDTTGSMRRLTTTGGEFIGGFANSLVWQFSGPNSNSATTVLDFSLVQPLLRYGGRAVVMENLTYSERTLLANVRQMEQFRRGFYIFVVAGRDAGEGPTRRGPVGVSGLGLLAGNAQGRVGPPSADGFLGLLQDQQTIRNQQSNVEALRDSLAQLEAAFDAGRIPARLQVDQARQAMLNGQSSLITAQTAFKTSVDAFKITLGIPPDVETVFDDPYLERFNLIDPRLTQMQKDLNNLLETLRDPEIVSDAESLLNQAKVLHAMKDRVDAQWNAADDDLQVLRERLPRRVEQLRRLRERPEVRNKIVDTAVYDEKTLLARVERISNSLPKSREASERMWSEFELLQGKITTLPLDEARQEVRTFAVGLSGYLLEMALDQAAARLESITLETVNVDPTTALEIARDERLDWMNARARLVDSWRQIEIDANALQSGLNLTFSGDMQNKGDNPIRFRGDTGRLRVGMQFDTPLTRLAERNLYRESQINFQRARRDYMLFGDQINRSLRNTLRIIELAQLNFELRRQAMRVSISQVGQARLRLNQPPKPAEQLQLGATTARDLVSALSDLLDSQNSFLNVWIGYEVLRMVLQFELGTLKLDERGQWVDPGPIEHEPRDPSTTEEIPAGAKEFRVLEDAPMIGPRPAELPSPVKNTQRKPR